MPAEKVPSTNTDLSLLTLKLLVHSTNAREKYDTKHELVPTAPANSFKTNFCATYARLTVSSGTTTRAEYCNPARQLRGTGVEAINSV